MSRAINFLRHKNRRCRRLIERSRRFKIRVSLMRNQGLSPAAAKEIASGYLYEQKR